MESTKWYKRISKKIFSRVTAVIIIAAILFSSVAALAHGSRTTLEYTPDGDIENSAENILAKNILHQNMFDYIMTAVPQNTLWGVYKTACNQIARSNFKSALENIDKCIGLYAGEGEEVLVDLWIKKGSLHTLLKEYDKAIAAFDKVLEEDPQNAEVLLIKAQVYYETAQFNRMCASLEKYLILRPDDTGVASLLESLRREHEKFRVSGTSPEKKLIDILTKAQTSADSGDFEGMIGYCEEYLAAAPDDLPVRLLTAQVSFATEDYEKTLYHCEYILNTEKNSEEENSEAEFLLASAYLQLSDFTSAEASLTRVLAGPQPEDFPDIYYFRGICRLALEDYDGAIDDFTESIMAEQAIQASIFNRSICYLIKELLPQGMEDLKRAADMDDDEDVKQQAILLLDGIKNEGEQVIVVQ